MWGEIKKILLKQSSNLIGIDIGTGSIKLVEVILEKSKPVLKNIGIKELPNNIVEDGRIIDSQQLTELLRQLLATTHITSKNTVVAVGGRIMFARELLFPTMTMTELGEAIKWDLEKYIPYAPNTYYYDYSIVGKGNIETEIKVLLVASPCDHVDMIIKMIKDVGLKLVAVDVEPLALYRIFTKAEKAMVIDIGAFLSQITVFQKGSPAVIRNIPIGGHNFSTIIMDTLEIPFHEAEQMKHHHSFLLEEHIDAQYVEIKNQMQILIDEFVRDIRRTAEYYQQQNRDVIIDEILITGGGSKLSNLIEYLSTQLDLPITSYDPLTKLKLAKTFDKDYLEQVVSQLGTAIGLALRGGDE